VGTSCCVSFFRDHLSTFLAFDLLRFAFSVLLANTVSRSGVFDSAFTVLAEAEGQTV
jgi:hypothetical protein